MVRHRFVVATLAGVEQGEVLGASPKRYAPRPIGTMGTASFRVPLEYDQADFLLAGDALLKVYMEGSRIPTGRQLAAHYRLITAEESAGVRAGGDKPPGVSTGWADASWEGLKRLVGKSKQGYSLGTALAMVDPTAIASDMLTTINAEKQTGLGLGTLGLSAPTYVSGWYFKPFMQAVAELAGALGPDWRCRGQELAGGVYGLLDMSGALGSSRPDSVFEFGDGLRNVAGYGRVVDLGGVANRVFHTPPGFPDSAQQDVLSDNDATSQAARNLLEEVVSADLSVDDLRTKLLAYHLLIRKLAKTTISFDAVRDSAPALPLFGVDYDTGDVVPFRASVRIKGKMTKRLDLQARLYQAEFDVAPDGSAQPTLTVTPS